MRRLPCAQFCLLPCMVLCAAASLLQGGDDGNWPGMEQLPEIVADVNGNPIYRRDLIRELVGTGIRAASERLAQRALVEQAARAKGVTVTGEELEQQFAQDKAELAAALVRTQWDAKRTFPAEEIIRSHYGMSIEDYKRTVVRQRLLTKRAIGDIVQPSEDDLIRYFMASLEQFQPPTVYRARHILISPHGPEELYRSLSASSMINRIDSYNAERRYRINSARDSNVHFRDEAMDLDPVWRNFRLKAEGVLRKIRSGQMTFDEAVKQYSQDPLDKPVENPLVDKQRRTERERAGMRPGEIGDFTQKGPMVQQFFDGVKNMKAGELGGPIRTPYGYHIVLMDSVTVPPRVTFDAVKPSVRRAYVERQLQIKSEAWLKTLAENAVVQYEPAQVWPPRGRPRGVLDIGGGGGSSADPDPVVLKVNGEPIRRSEIWRELVRAEGEEALTRLINLEIVMTLLRNNGLQRLEWECANPSTRSAQPPPARPISVSAAEIDLELNDDRLRQEFEAPSSTFADYIFERYGQTVDDYRRKIEAGLILRAAIRTKVPLDEETLKVQFALAKDQYVDREFYDISHILIVPTGGMEKAAPEAHAQARLIADTVYKMFCDKPESFSELQRDYSMETRTVIRSRHGKLGPCSPEMPNSDLPEGAVIYEELRRQRVQKGQASTPIRTFRGYHIVRVDDYRPSRPATFANVRFRVERDYLQERAKMYTDIWLRGLSERARVKKFIFQRTDELPLKGIPPDELPLPDK